LKASDPEANVLVMEGGFFSGQLLIAMPGISDPRFERALILICAHDEAHAMGLAVNNPVEGLTVPDLLDKLDITATITLPPDLVLMGGPVERERGFVLHSTDYEGEASLEVGPGVALSATREVLEAMARHNGAPSKSLLALGYAGWGAGQLEDEIKANVWLTCDADDELIFGHDFTKKWTRALGKLGVDPERLSSVAGRA
jgi:putative transcriptional regulator